MDEYLLRLQDVSVALKRGDREMVSAVTLGIKPRELFGIVGESGSGKTLLALTVFGLHEDTYVASGKIAFNGREIARRHHRAEMKRLLGRNIGFIPQDPFSSLNPSMRVGKQITEAIYLSKGESPRSQQSKDAAVSLLNEVGIPEPELAFRQYPEQFSGGMRQRIVIAIALSQEPDLLIADEPTTALDAVTQRHIIDLIVERSRSRNLSVILISHNLELLRQSVDRIAVLYSGQLLSIFEASELGHSQLHPYPQALFDCLPTAEKSLEDLRPIPGEAAGAGYGRTGCAFAARCFHVTDLCRSDAIPTNDAFADRFSACLVGKGA